MKINEFKDWLNEKYQDSPTTVANRISNCKNIEKYYGDLDIFCYSDEYNSILESFKYSTEDERNNVMARHLVPINGNVRTGTATLKQALGLYKQFCLDNTSVEEQDNSLAKVDDSIVVEESMPHVSEIHSIIDRFQYNKTIHSYISVLQLDLLDFLSNQIKNYNWEIEYKPSKSVKDSVDICGQACNSDYKVIIELDTHRADQVSKKFVSRMSLFMDDRVIYFSLCYPGTTKMSKNECVKYFEYCSRIAKRLSSNSAEKYFIGKFFN